MLPLLALFVASVAGKTVRWVGLQASKNDHWDVSTNWDPAGVPAIGDDVIIDYSTHPYYSTTTVLPEVALNVSTITVTGSGTGTLTINAANPGVARTVGTLVIAAGTAASVKLHGVPDVALDININTSSTQPSSLVLDSVTFTATNYINVFQGAQMTINPSPITLPTVFLDGTITTTCDTVVTSITVTLLASMTGSGTFAIAACQAGSQILAKDNSGAALQGVAILSQGSEVTSVAVLVPATNATMRARQKATLLVQAPSTVVADTDTDSTISFGGGVFHTVTALNAQTGLTIGGDAVVTIDLAGNTLRLLQTDHPGAASTTKILFKGSSAQVADFACGHTADVGMVDSTAVLNFGNFRAQSCGATLISETVARSLRTEGTADDSKQFNVSKRLTISGNITLANDLKLQLLDAAVVNVTFAWTLTGFQTLFTALASTPGGPIMAAVYLGSLDLASGGNVIALSTLDTFQMTGGLVLRDSTVLANIAANNVVIPAIDVQGTKNDTTTAQVQTSAQNSLVINSISTSLSDAVLYASIAGATFACGTKCSAVKSTSKGKATFPIAYTAVGGSLPVPPPPPPPPPGAPPVPQPVPVAPPSPPASCKSGLAWGVGIAIGLLVGAGAAALIFYCLGRRQQSTRAEAVPLV